VVFHNVADSESAFTRGLGITITSKDFESALKFLTTHYNPVRLLDVLADPHGYSLPTRPVLVTFDDAYASVYEVAAPICRRYGVPALFFVNAAFLDNRQLALSNLVCYVANMLGMDAISAAAGIASAKPVKLRSLKDALNHFVPAISLPVREAFHEALVDQLKTDEAKLAGQARLYLTGQQLQELAACDFEIGNHTYTHVHCRQLTGKGLNSEIDRNRTALEALLGKGVRSFSIPYGSSEDLSDELALHLKRAGYGAAFLAEGMPNQPRTAPFGLNRVSINEAGEAALFSNIEILPRFRALGKWLSGNSKPGAGR
jgi:peptidoglycan/xylan/chitin deacetylase (PgdA/CDA1 family)